MATTPLVQSLATAISQQENTNPAYNNPGALTSIPGGWTGQTGVAANGIATFDTPQDGWNALYSQVQTNINRGLTLNQFFAGVPGGYPGYASAAAGNNPTVYAANVSAWTGIDPNTPLNQIQAGTVSAGIPGSDTQPIVDLSGSAAASPTSDILSSLESSVASVDLTNPYTDVALLVGGAAVLWMAMR